MTFEETLEGTLKKIIPKIVENAILPIRAEINRIKENNESPYGAKSRFSVTEIAEITGRSRSTIHKDIKNEKLSAYTPENGNNMYVALSEAMRYFNLYQAYHT